MSDLTIYRSDTVKLNLAVTSGGSIYNLTGSSIWFTAKNQYSDLDAAAVFQKSTLNGGIVITNPTQGIAQVTIASADTLLVPNLKTILVWDAQIKDSQGNIYTIASGRLIVLPEVTRTT
jgi:hypothetical protein